MNNTTGPLMPSHTLLYADAEIEDIRTFLTAVHDAADNLHAHITCINADRVAGRLHLNAALTHACRTWFVDRNPVARSFEMELLLWVAATRQTSVAAGFGAQKGTMPLWIVIVPGTEDVIDEISHLPGITLSPSPPPDSTPLGAGKRSRLMQDFAISETELATIGADRLPELVAERVALSAVYR